MISISAKAQQVDTLRKIDEVTIRAYLTEQQLLKVPASVSVLSASQLSLQPQNTLVSAMNTMPGVRMEERTPGSYRLSLRGSLLRSPFGIRNIKVYIDEIPLTDAGGNTYLNALDLGVINNIEVLKGPDGSLFGANSGGVVLINSVGLPAKGSTISANINAGSYGLFQENISLNKQFGKHHLNINHGYQSYDGYREHSSMQRNFIQLSDKYKYGESNSVKAYGFYAHLQYQTPGGLNLTQFNANPRLSRQATATLPGAIEQQIGIENKMWFGGITNEVYLSNRIRNVSVVMGTRVNFENPFITNYEHRKENTYGARSYFELKGIPRVDYDWKLNLGAEWQQTNAIIDNYDNIKGVKGGAQAFDEVNTNQHFFFTRYAATFLERLNFEAAVSLNYYTYRFKNIFPLSQTDFNIKRFEPQVMPRMAMSYELVNNFMWRASVSRGYSAPTISEVRPSNNLVNTNLQAETGWNYETGFRFKGRDDRILLDASVFHYQLKNSIVNRRLPDETDYFMNAGGTKQLGLELNLSAWVLAPVETGFVRGIQFNEAFTYSDFRFKNYTVNNVDYSGNWLTGVPKKVMVSSLQLRFPKNIYTFLQHNFTDKIPVNDANTVYAERYNLLQAKLGWKFNISKTNVNFYAGADNLLNEKYSLGNDLNAIGNRFYNPAPLRNYYFGINIML